MSTTPLNALRVFEAVARTGSFRAAADQLCVTQSAVSHQIRRLEDWLGTPLFLREGNRTRQLPHAQDLAQSLTRSLGEIDAACQRARARPGRQPLVIAAIPSVAMCWLIPRLAGFRTAHPEVETRVIYAMHGRDINFREAHVAFVFGPRPPEAAGVEAIPFLPGTSVPVCSPSLLPDGRDVTPGQMLRLGLLHDADTGGWQTWLADAGQPVQAPLAGPIFEDFNLLRIAALSGQGVALCSSAMIGPDLEAGRLVQLSERAVLNDHGYSLLIGPRGAAEMPAEVQAFRDWALAARGDQG